MVFETGPQEFARLTGTACAQHSLGNDAKSREALAQEWLEMGEAMELPVTPRLL